MKFFRALVLAIVALLISSSAFAQVASVRSTCGTATFATPEGVELETFPYFIKPLTVGEMAALDLHPKILTQTMKVDNYHFGMCDRNGRFVLETLPVGTVILVDKDGTPRYKADCGNRIVERMNHVDTDGGNQPGRNTNSATSNGGGSATGVIIGGPGFGDDSKPPTPRRNIWQGFSDGMNSFGRFLRDVIFPFLGWLLLIVLMVILIGSMITAIWDWFRNRNATPVPAVGVLPATPPAPQPVVAAAPLVPATPVAPVAQTPTDDWNIRMSGSGRGPNITIAPQGPMRVSSESSS